MTRRIPATRPHGPAQALFKNVPDVVVRVRAPLFKETSLRAGFLLSGIPVDFWSL